MAQIKVGQEIYEKVYGDFALNTLLAGEDQERDWQKFVNGASEGKGVPSGVVDFLLGTSASNGDYFLRLQYAVKSAGSSQIVVREGLTAPVYASTASSSTASTTTTLNTAINPDPVLANQFRDCLVKVGSEYRHIEAHPAFAAGVVNQFTVDRAFSSAPASGTAINILDRNFAFEAVPHGVAAGTSAFLDIMRACRQPGWHVTTGDGVRIPSAVGDFT